jgi:hypothetical protein
VDAANKFRLRKQLLVKHMVFKRIKRVTKAEKNWLSAVKKELEVYTKKRFMRYWKVYMGMLRLKKSREDRTKKIVVKKLIDNYQRHILNEQIAIAYRNKCEKSQLFEYWHQETQKVLKIKKGEEMAKSHYDIKLKKKALNMMNEYLEMMRKINSDEFLKLAETQDYFEIGVTQVKLHKY